jgi:hypothetical protein
MSGEEDRGEVRVEREEGRGIGGGGGGGRRVMVD